MAMHIATQQFFTGAFSWSLEGMDLQCPDSIICMAWLGTEARAELEAATVGAKKTAIATTKDKGVLGLIV